MSTGNSQCTSPISLPSSRTVVTVLIGLYPENTFCQVLIHACCKGYGNVSRMEDGISRGQQGQEAKLNYVARIILVKSPSHMYVNTTKHKIRTILLFHLPTLPKKDWKTFLFILSLSKVLQLEHFLSHDMHMLTRVHITAGAM